MPIFAMMANKLPTWVRKDIDSICKKFLWAGSDSSVRGKCLVAWPVVTKPTDLGGLGVLDLKLLNIALQTRWLWLQRADENRVWSGLPIKVAAEVRAFFEASIFIKIGNGRRTLFWQDKWLDGEAISTIAPDLFAAIPRRTTSSLTVADEHIHLRDGEEDSVVWKWSEKGVYTANSAYRALHLSSQQFPGHQLIWDSWFPLRVKLFLWLAHRRRLWTADRRRRHGLDAHDLCWLCNQRPETCFHLLVECRFTIATWEVIFARAGLSLPAVAGCQGLLDWWRRIRECWAPPRRKGVDTLFGLVCWTVWKERNACCFNGDHASFRRNLEAVRDSAQLWVLGGAVRLGELGLS
ncbi:hypothetical protein BS78_04G300500 [Paspalum vaginatum]|nr:hypothetical protein BS78_04G300500 [Paspalum vaginatum]